MSIRSFSTGQRVLTTSEVATVISIAKAAGDRAEPGDVLMVLESRVLKNEAELASIRLRCAEIEQKEALLDFQQRLSEVDFELQRSKISLQIPAVELEVNKALLEKNVISALRYAQIQAENDQRESELDAVLKKQVHLKKSQVQRINMMEELVSLERLNVERVRERLDQLRVIATEAVVVKELFVTVGDSIQQGSRLVLIGREKPDAVRLRFPQQDLSQLSAGTALKLHSNGEDFMATISRVMPDLQDGYVVVEAGTDKIPENARTEMTVQGRVHKLDTHSIAAIYEPDFSLIPGQEVTLSLRRDGNTSTIVLSDVERDGNWLVFPTLLRNGDEVILRTDS